MQKYDVAAYIWPAYSSDDRARIFWPNGMGEWESVLSAKSKFKGHTWPRKPLWGYVNEADPYVMEMEINAAADYGVNVFIYDWYWYDQEPFLENCLNSGYLKARNRDRIHFYLMWANHDAVTTWDKRISDEGDKVVWSGLQNRSEFEKICMRLITNYFVRPEYYKIDNKPVFMIYEADSFIKGIGGLEEAADALQWFRKQVVASGFDGLHLQATLRKGQEENITGIPGDSQEVQKYILDALGFDSLTHYQFCHFTPVNRDYREILVDVRQEWKRISEEYTMPYFPHISVGWDNNPRYQELRENITIGNTPEAFETALRMAKAYLDRRCLLYTSPSPRD